MPKGLIRACVLLGCSVVFGHFAFSQDINALTDKFFDGLAAVIERDMDNPAKCLQEVNAYYQNNQATVQKIRTETAKAMQEVTPMMQEYMDNVNKAMTSSDFDASGLEDFAGKMNAYKAKTPPPSAAARRYTEALEAFTARHPDYAMKVALKALDLMPEMNLPFGQTAPLER